MNETEKTAYKWLLSKGYKPNEIAYQAKKTPDFICSDNSKFEVKRLYGNVIWFHRKQFNELRESKDIFIVVFDDARTNPVTQFKSNTLKEGAVIDGVIIKVSNYRVNTSYTTANILLSQQEDLQNIVKSDPSYSNVSQAVREAVRRFIETEKPKIRGDGGEMIE